MIINSQSDRQVAIVGGESRKATINPEEIAKLQYLLTKGLYTDPIGAVITEWTNNAVDSVVQSGKDPLQVPVIVEIGYNIQGNHFLRVTDKGTGLDKETFENVCMNYLTSTKTQSNDYIGSFGIGMKSFLSLDRNAIFTCRKDGKEYKFNVYQGVEFVEFDLLFEGDTTEENGVICELPIKDWSEYSKFKEKAKKKLAYYDTVLLFVDNQEEPVENTIYRKDSFQWSTLVNKNVPLHMSLKDVYYEIDFTKLEIPTIYFPVCLRFSLEDGLSPTPSREGIIYNEETKRLILNKIREVADFFVEMYNNANLEIDPEVEPLKAIEYIRNSQVKDFYVDFEGQTWKINEIAKQSSILRQKYKIKGISRPLTFYKERLGAFTLNVEMFKWVNSYGQISRKVSGYTLVDYLDYNSKHKIILVDPTFCKNKLSIYISGKYCPNGDSILVTKNPRKLPLRRKSNYTTNSWENLLELKNSPKSEWRKMIQEWQYLEKCFESVIIDATQEHLSEEYQAYKLETTSKSESNYVRLDKQEDEITYHYNNPHSSRVYKLTSKKTIKVNLIGKTAALFVLVSEGQEEQASKWQEILRRTKVVFVKVGPRDLKKIPKTHNFITMEDFIKTSKPFRKFVTALRISQFTDNLSYTNLHNISLLSRGFNEEFKELREYQRAYQGYIGGHEEIEESVLKVAEEFNLWDEEIIHKVKAMEKKLKEYDFILLFNEKAHDKNLLNKVVNQIMLFRKLYKNQFENHILIEKAPEVEVIAATEEEQAEEQTDEEVLIENLPY